MNLIVQRNVFSSVSVVGRLSLVDADSPFDCYTLEPSWKTDGSKPRCTPFGTYPLTIRWSWKHKRFLPHVENVPGFDAVELHIGNSAEDTDGCTLVGATNPQPNFIGQSLIAFTQLFNLLLAGATLTNPTSPEQNQIWTVGSVSYADGRTPAIQDVNGE